MPERQRTLRATIAWSHDLLTSEEQRLFARLSVVRGGCTLDAAEKICDAELDTLQALVEKSLLRHVEERYRLLETIREYAAERLAATTDADQVHRRHAEYFLALAEEAEPEVRFAAATPERRSSASSAKTTTSVPLSTTSSRPSGPRLHSDWPARCPLTGTRCSCYPREGATWTARLPPTKVPQRHEPKPFLGRHSPSSTEEIPKRRSSEQRKRSRSIEKLGDAWWTARDLWYLGRVAFEVEGDLAKAQQLFEETAARCRALQDDRSLIMAIDFLARIQRHRGDLASTRSLYEEILDLTHATGDLRWETRRCTSSRIALWPRAAR